MLVNVFGRFPPSSLDTLTGPDECGEATRRTWRAEDIATAPRILGVDVARFGVAGKASDPRYANKRTEMYFEAVDWIRNGGALPPDTSQELIAALTRTTYSFRGDRLLLEPKDQVKARLGYSPDDADALAAGAVPHGI